MVVWRIYDVLAYQPLPYLEGGRFRRRREPQGRRVQSLGLRRQMAFHVRRLTVEERVRENLRGTVAHHLCGRYHYADVDPPRHRRSPRPNHQRLRVVPRSQGQWCHRKIHRHSRGCTLSLRRSRARVRHIPRLARLARSVLEVVPLLRLAFVGPAFRLIHTKSESTLPIECWLLLSTARSQETETCVTSPACWLRFASLPVPSSPLTRTVNNSARQKSNRRANKERK